MAQRQEYAIGDAVTDRREAAAVCTAVLEVLRPMIRIAHVDVYSDYDDQMPEAVRRAEAQLAALAELSKRR